MIALELDGAVATIAFDAPARRNAMTPEMGDALRDTVAKVRATPQVRAVVLTGHGPAFSAGGDLKMLKHLRTVSKAEAKAHMLAFYERYLSILDLEVPTIAAVRGPAIGAGLCVALACDLCVVDEGARLALNFAALGLFPGMGATYFVPRRAGAQRALELLTTGRTFDGTEAVQLGLALKSVRAPYVRGEATTIARAIAASGPMAVRALKKSLGVDRKALASALEYEATHQAESYASADLAEGLQAAAEKRTPKFANA